MNLHTRRSLYAFMLMLLACGVLCGVARAQTPQPSNPPVFADCAVTPAPADARKLLTGGTQEQLSGIRLIVKDANGKPVERKRFYLLTKDVRSAGIDWNTVPRRDEYMQGASLPLQQWLKQHDCDSLYCPEYEAAYEAAVKTVPEFRKAYEAGLRKYRNEKLALKWLMVNFPLKQVRTAYYKKKKAWLERAAERAGVVKSVMTGEKGDAYFTSVKTGTYYISNLFPLEQGQALWSCEVVVPPPLPRQIHSVSVNFTIPQAPATSQAK